MSDFGDWNPMREDYHDESNRYDTGPGAEIPRDSQPFNEKNVRKQCTKLFVGNIPENIDENALTNIFSKYGPIKNLFINANHSFSGVTFESEKAAHDALNGLKDNPDYKFRISFFRERDKTTTDNMHKRRQQYHPVNEGGKSDANRSTFENDHQKSQSSGVHSESRSFYRPSQSNTFSVNHVVSPVNASSRFSNPQSRNLDLKPLPNCKNCGVRTLEQCMKCNIPYCTKKCMVLGFQYHTDVCIIVAPHSTDAEFKSRSSDPEVSRTLLEQRTLTKEKKDTTRLLQLEPSKEMDEFRGFAKDYRQYQTTSSQSNDVTNKSLNISNSYDNDDLIRENARCSDDVMKKKSLSGVSNDAIDGREAVSSHKFDRSERKHDYGQQREKENRPPYSKNYDEPRRRNESSDNRGGSTSENRDKKIDFSARDDGKSSSRNQFNGSRNDENRSGEYRPKRDYESDSRPDNRNRNEARESKSYDASNSRYGNREQNSAPKYDDRSGDYRPKKSFDDKKESEKNNSGDNNVIIDEGQIAFSNVPPKFSEKKRPTSESAKKPDSRIRSGAGDSGSRISSGASDVGTDTKNSNNGTTEEAPVLKGQSSGDSKHEMELRNRRSFQEEDILEVRLNELVTDMPGYCSIKVVEEESLLPKLLADLMRETYLPPPDLKPLAKCLVRKNDEWIRAVVIELCPLTVKYIDKGYSVQECDKQNIRGCPDKYQTIRPFAYKVKFLNAEETDLETLMKEKKIFEIIIRKKIKELVWEVELLASKFSERLKEARQTRASRTGEETRTSRTGEEARQTRASRTGEETRTSRTGEEARQTKASSTGEEARQTKASSTGQSTSGTSYKTQTITSGTNQSSSTESNNPVPKLLDKLVLKEGVPMKLFVTYIEENGEIFYVTRHDDIFKMNKAIAEHKVLKKLERIEKDTACLAQMEGEWYRAIIVETDPLKVYFCDFGNTETVKADDLRQTLIKCQGDDPLAIKAKLDQGKPSECNIVEYEQALLTPIKFIDREKLWIMNAGEWMKVMVLQILSENECFVIKESDKPLCEQINQLPKTPLKSEPEIGCKYLIEYEGARWRVELIKPSPPTVLYIDYGNEEEISLDRLYELPSDWKKKPSLAFKVTLLPGQDKIEEWKEICIMEVEDQKWKIRQ